MRSFSLSLWERAGVRGSWLRSEVPTVLLGHGCYGLMVAPQDSLTPTLSRRERESSAAA